MTARRVTFARFFFAVCHAQIHSLITHSAYHDLKRLLRDDGAHAILGKPHLVERGGKAYCDELFRLGNAAQNRYMSKDSAGLRNRIARHTASQAEAQIRAQERSLARAPQHIGSAVIRSTPFSTTV